jgi:hypothetical protein
VSASPAPNDVSIAAQPKRRLDVAFIIVSAILLIAAIGLNTAVQSLKLSFRKQPVPLQMPLKQIAPRFGPWVQVSADERLPHETEEALAANEYIFRDYVDSRLVPANVIKQFEGQPAGERARMLEAVRARTPQAVMNMAVTYYTGMVDTVAHIPDRCYVADGFSSSDTQTVRWACFSDRGDRAAAQFIHFEDDVPGRGAVSRNVAYFFHVNGRYTNDSIDVRTELQNLFQKHGYYAKIELLTVLKDRAAAAAVIDDFLKHALPEVEKSLPDWKKVKAGEKSAGE